MILITDLKEIAKLAHRSRKTRTGSFVHFLNESPCPLLTGNLCSVYEHLKDELWHHR